MQNHRIILVGAALAALLLAGCSPDDPTKPEYSRPTGTDALTRYVAIGNSLTAGFMDGGLAMPGQLDSFPAQIARQLGYNPMPGSDNWFAQPLMALPGVGSTQPADSTYVHGIRYWDEEHGAIAVLDSVLFDVVQAEVLITAQNPTPYPNLGVPGATARDVTDAFGRGTSQADDNKYFNMILRNPTFGDTAMIDQAVSQGPTLVTLWIGSNDVLGGALTGNPVVGENVTSPDGFEALLTQSIVRLYDEVEARFGYRPHLVVGNIGSISTSPFFVPKALFDGVVGTTYPTIENDVALVLLPALGMVPDIGPLPDFLTLTATEVEAIESTIVEYNGIITSLAEAYDFTVADVNGMLAGFIGAPETTHFQFLLGADPDMPVEVAAGLTAFSLDGLHPNNRGYSMVANVFIDAINEELELMGDDAIAPLTEAVWDPTYTGYVPRTVETMLAGW